VVSDVIVGYIVKEETTSPSQERSVHSCCCSTKERPSFPAVVRNRWVRMMQIREHYYPVVRELRVLSVWSDVRKLGSIYQVWDEVEFDKVSDAHLRGVVRQ
jgi:hypothetical protein